MSDEDGQARVLCQEQLSAHRNMTDVVAALRLLVDDGGAVGEEALAEYYERWKGDQLVLDKWFAIQATSKREDTLQRVRRLLSHPDYAITNPNRVRSLVGAFCMGNQHRFHAADGAGYRFLAERVLELDPVNPQIASRLLQAMVRWRRFDTARQGLMRAALERILEVENLSNDVYEVASKSLAD
jgi:aminopeptidase N